MEINKFTQTLLGLTMFGKKPALPVQVTIAKPQITGGDMNNHSDYAPPQYRESPLDAITAQIQSLKLQIAQLQNDVTMADQERDRAKQERDEAKRKLDEARGIFRVWLASVESWQDDDPIPLPRKKGRKEKVHENNQVDPVVTVEPVDTGTAS